MRRRQALIVLAAALAVPAAAAAAPARDGGGGVNFHDARYCEILELKNMPPNAQVVVWNTIGSNTCPAAWWKAFDAQALAKELGDPLVVLNGPRHFLMDSAAAVTGGKRTFHGQRMTKVATITIPTADELVATPYFDRVITRNNDWRWKKGRRIFELLAPGGDTYVMQSYSQIIDPSLTLAQLPGLASRLDLPPGWRYRSRTLTKPLRLNATGTATITQDVLGNSYQLATTTRKAGPRKRRAVNLAAKTKKQPDRPDGKVEDRGTFTGTPFGSGTIRILGTFTGGVFDATFRMLTPKGEIVGRTKLPFTISGGEIDFRGTGTITGGTGAYRGITGKDVKIHDHNTLDGQNGVVEVEGFATY